MQVQYMYLLSLSAAGREDVTFPMTLDRSCDRSEFLLKEIVAHE